MHKRLAGGLCAALFAAAAPAFAHHSFAIFDMDKERVIVGTATQFQWANPHIWIEMDVPDAKGGMSHWSIEGGGVTGLSRVGWRRDTIKPGDKITMVVHPLKDGTNGGSLMGVTLPDGRHFGSSIVAPGAP